MAENDADIRTRLIHTADKLNETMAVTPPIFQTSTYRMESPEHGADLASTVAPAEFYTRYGSPNNKQVEAIIANLEGAEAALALASGAAAAATAVLANVKSGDHVVAQRTHYTATLSLLTELLPRFGVDVSQVDQADIEAFEQAIRPNTRIVYTETPTNPTMELTDLSRTAELAHAAGALAITDNTFATPYNQRPIDFGYDLVVHSATKYLNGHADVTAGVIAGSRHLVERAWEYLRINGPVLHPFEAWLLRRGLQTFAVRMAIHNDNGLEIARFLELHPAVARVHYPGLPSHPQHELARRQMLGGFGGMLSFDVRGGYDAALTVLGRTRLCVLAVSLGGMETLITHPASMVHVHQSDIERDSAGIAPGLLRLSVGIEAPADLIADLDQALG